MNKFYTYLHSSKSVFVKSCWSEYYENFSKMCQNYGREIQNLHQKFEYIKGNSM